MIHFLNDYLNVRVADIQPHVYEFHERAKPSVIFSV